MLSKTSTQVINAFIELAKLPAGQCEGVGSIAKRIHAPQNYLGKMLQNLVSHDLLISQKGAGGGFRLKKPASQISLFDIVEPIDRPSLWSECALGSQKCSDENPCVLHDRWWAVRETYYSFLRKTTVADLIKS